jgi:ABC-2 type transport system ATP-binding protein
LDEPMSGLDPVGRKEVRDLIHDERKKGRTIFFSTHILSDVETLCDRVTILRRGEVVVGGRLADLLKREVRRTDVTISEASEAFVQRLESEGHQIRKLAARVVIEIEGEARVPEVLRAALAAGARVTEVIARHETLEDLFVREAIEAPEGEPAADRS